MSTFRKSIVKSAWMLGTASLLYYLSANTILSLLALFAVPVPFVLLGRKRSLQESVVVLILFALFGFYLDGLVGGLLTFLLGATGFVMALLYEKRENALAAVAGGAGVLLLSLVINIAVLTFVIHIDIPAEMDKVKQELISGTGTFMTSPFMTAEQWKKQVEMQFAMMKAIFPTFMIIGCFTFSVMIHALSRLGGKLMRQPIPALKPMREWSFPRSLLYYYFAALFILFLSGEETTGTFLGNTLLNLRVMLDTIFTIQGLSFCLLAIYLKQRRILAPVLVVSLFIFPVLTYILSLLGIFDLGMDLRKKLETRVKRG